MIGASRLSSHRLKSGPLKSTVQCQGAFGADRRISRASMASAEPEIKPPLSYRNPVAHSGLLKEGEGKLRTMAWNRAPVIVRATKIPEAPRVWPGEPPARCSIEPCAHKIRSVFVHGQVQCGGWGIMCLACHRVRGMGVGQLGHLYQRRASDGRFVCSK